MVLKCKQFISTSPSGHDSKVFNVIVVHEYYKLKSRCLQESKGGQHECVMIALSMALFHFYENVCNKACTTSTSSGALSFLLLFQYFYNLWKPLDMLAQPSNIASMY